LFPVFPSKLKRSLKKGFVYQAGDSDLHK